MWTTSAAPDGTLDRRSTALLIGTPREDIK